MIIIDVIEPNRENVSPDLDVGTIPRLPDTQSELTDWISVGDISEIATDLVVDVLTEKLNGAVAHQDMTTSGMGASRSSPVPSTASRHVGIGIRPPGTASPEVDPFTRSQVNSISDPFGITPRVRDSIFDIQCPFDDGYGVAGAIGHVSHAARTVQSEQAFRRF